MSVFGILKGLLGNGKTLGFRNNGAGDLGVEIGGSNVSAFGDIRVVEMTPLFQYDFVYQSTVNPQLMIHTTANTGVVDTSSSRLRLQTGVNAAGSAIHQSAKIARYRAGQGNLARFTYAWETGGVANSKQIVGMANVSAGQTAIDGYFFGYDNTSFGICHRLNGSDVWTPQASWNGDRCDGSGGLLNMSGFNWTNALRQNGIPMMIQYPYLGYGDIFFYVQHPLTGRWINVHTIRYGATSPLVQLSNPGLNFFAQAINSGNTSNIVGYIGSVGVFLSGKREFTGPEYGWDNRVANTGANVEYPIFTIRNCTSFNGVPNRGMIRLRSLSFSADGANTDCRLRLRHNATLTGATFARAVNGTSSNNGLTITAGQSMTSIDIAATAVAAFPTDASDVRFNSVGARNTDKEIDLSSRDIYVLPGNSLSFCMTSTLANNASWVAANWVEDQ